MSGYTVYRSVARGKQDKQNSWVVATNLAPYVADNARCFKKILIHHHRNSTVWFVFMSEK